MANKKPLNQDSESVKAPAPMTNQTGGEIGVCPACGGKEEYYPEALYDFGQMPLVGVGFGHCLHCGYIKDASVDEINDARKALNSEGV